MDVERGCREEVKMSLELECRKEVSKGGSHTGWVVF